MDYFLEMPDLSRIALSMLINSVFGFDPVAGIKTFIASKG